MSSFPSSRLLAVPEVLQLTTLSRATIWRMVQRGGFPPPLKIGLRRIAWREQDVLDWIAARRTARASEGAPVFRTGTVPARTSPPAQSIARKGGAR